MTRRVLLVQVRSPDDPMSAHERECVERRINGRPVQVRAVNALAESARAEWLDDAEAMIIGGSGDFSVHHPSSRPFVEPMRRLLDRALTQRTPTFGICFGHQLLAHHLGAEVETCVTRTEIGTVRVELTHAGKADPLFGDLGDPFHAHTGHSDWVTRVPGQLENLATNAAVPAQAFKVRGAPIYTTQFHPDMTGAEARSRYLAYQGGFAGAGREEAEARAERFRTDRDEAEGLIGRFVDLFVAR